MENVDHHQEIVRPRCVYVRTKRSKLTNRIKEFLQNAGIKTIIAFSGSADIEEGKVRSVIEEAIKKFSQFKSVAILTGGTSFGVPKIATEMGKKYGLKVIAVTPSTGIKHKLSAKLLDLRIIVEPMYDTSEWSELHTCSKLTNAASRDKTPLKLETFPIQPTNCPFLFLPFLVLAEHLIYCMY
jgi:hypothetical protein